MHPKRNILHYGAELVLFLSLVAVLVFAVRLILQTRQTASNNSATSVAYPLPEGDVITPPAVGVEPSLCQFGGGPTPETITALHDDYIFSQPQIVLTSTTSVGIADWLPDSERLLIRRSAGNGYQTIETFNYRTGQTTIYAKRDGEGGKPMWMNEQNAVAYAALVRDHEELWISYGDPQKSVLISTDVSGWSLAGDGQRLVYFSPTTEEIPQTWDASGKTVQGMDIDLAHWMYPKFSTDLPQPAKGRTFQTILQPGGTKLAFYGHGWFFLFDEITKQVCEINLEPYGGNSVLRAAWSPNGRHIAMIATPNIPGELISASSIIILDLVSGQMYHPALAVPVVRDIAWSNDNQRLAVLGADPTEFEQGSPRSKIYILDALGDGLAKEISTQLLGGGATNGWQLAWSPDGKKIAVKCPVWLETGLTIIQDRICMIEVSKQP